MTYTKVSDREPKHLLLDEKKTSMNLIVHGQGVFIFQNQDNTKSSCFQFYNKDDVFFRNALIFTCVTTQYVKIQDLKGPRLFL